MNGLLRQKCRRVQDPALVQIVPFRCRFKCRSPRQKIEPSYHDSEMADSINLSDSTSNDLICCSISLQECIIRGVRRRPPIFSITIVRNELGAEAHSKGHGMQCLHPKGPRRAACHERLVMQCLLQYRFAFGHK